MIIGFEIWHFIADLKNKIMKKQNYFFDRGMAIA